MYKTNIHSLYYLLLPVLVIGIPLGYTSFAIALVALVPLLFLTTRHTVGLFFVMYGGELGGVIRAMYPAIPIYGYVLIFIGVLLLWDVISELFKKQSRSIQLLITILLFFGVFYLLGPRDEFSNGKYLSMWTNGIFTLAGYYALARSEKIKAEELTPILILGAICMMTFVIKKYSFVTGGLFDFDWFREQNVQYEYATYRNENDRMLISYQHIGMMALYGCVILLSQVRLKKTSTIIYMACIFMIVLISGCRQAIFGVAVAALLRYAVFRLDYITGHNINSRIIWIVVGTILAYFAVDIVASFSDVVGNTVSEGDAGRNYHYILALDIFNNSPFLGAGIGGFHAKTDLPWPHNFFLELLCECGIVGTVLFLGILIIVLYNKRVKLLTITPSNMFFFLVMVALFVRVMVSSDFRESIELFTAAFAITATSGIARNVLLGIRKPKR